MTGSRNPARGLVGASLALALAVASGNCSIVLVQGPPKPGEADYDATGRYPDGVPCTDARTWSLVDAAMALAALITTTTYDPDEQRDDIIDGLLSTAAAGISAWIGLRRTNACRAAQAAAIPAPTAAPFR